MKRQSSYAVLLSEVAFLFTKSVRLRFPFRLLLTIFLVLYFFSSQAQTPDTALAKLFSAIKNNRLDSIKYFTGAINSKDTFGWSPLMTAVFANRYEIAKMLIEKGAAVNAVNKENGTALFMAAAQGSLDISKLLILHKADVNTAYQFETTPLVLAAGRQDTALVKLLLQHGANRTIKLMEVARAKKNRHIIELVKYPYSSAQKTCIMNAFREIAQAHKNQFLFSWNETNEIETAVNKKLIYTDAPAGLLDALRMLGLWQNDYDKAKIAVAACLTSGKTGTRDTSFSKLFSAIRNNKQDSVSYFIESGGINQKNTKGNAPLHVAILNSDFEIVKTLLEKGAMADVPDKDSITPLMIACSQGDFEISKLLIANKADVNRVYKNAYGSKYTPIALAAGAQHTELVKLLLQKGAKRTKELMDAARDKKNKAIIELVKYPYTAAQKTCIMNIFDSLQKKYKELKFFWNETNEIYGIMDIDISRYTYSDTPESTLDFLKNLRIDVADYNKARNSVAACRK